MNLDDAGDVVLKDLQLKAEALNALKLPITVKAGFLGSVTLKVHYSQGVSGSRNYYIADILFQINVVCLAMMEPGH